MITAEEINVLIQEGIRKFGEHNYFDKGPHESMDFPAIKERFDDMTPQQVADVLAEVRDVKYGEDFVRSMICELDTEDRMDPIYADERICDLY